MSVLDDRIRDVVRTIGESAPNPPALRQDPIRTPLSGRRIRGPLLAVVSFVVVVGVFVGAGFLFGGQNQTPATNATQLSIPDVTQPATTNPSGPTTPPSSEAEIAELLNGFLEARIAGDGAQEYLNVPEEDIPLLYATTSGAPYERAEFETVGGVEWPYGFSAFKVRLFAGDTVVEQLFFTPADDSLGLEYQPDGFGTEIAPTTEDGQPVARAYNYFDGEVTLNAAHPWIFHDPNSYPNPFGRLIPEGPVAPTTDGGERGDWDELHLIADPVPAGSFAPGADCQPDPGPADAEALAESIRSYPGLEATAPVAVSVGGADALMMDVVITAGARITVAVDDGGDLCANGLLYPVIDKYALGAQDQAKGERVRLYLFDMPEELSMRTMAIVVAPESRFERAVEAAAPVVDSIEFHAP